MAKKNLITEKEFSVIHALLKRLEWDEIEDNSGDWLANLQTTDFSTLMGHLPEMAANTTDGELKKQIGWLSNLLYTIAIYQNPLRRVADFLTELNFAQNVYLHGGMTNETDNNNR